jgi:hypothetical protein
LNLKKQKLENQFFTFQVQGLMKPGAFKRYGSTGFNLYGVPTGGCQLGSSEARNPHTNTLTSPTHVAGMPSRIPGNTAVA